MFWFNARRSFTCQCCNKLPQHSVLTLHNKPTKLSEKNTKTLTFSIMKRGRRTGHLTSITLYFFRGLNTRIGPMSYKMHYSTTNKPFISIHSTEPTENKIIFQLGHTRKQLFFRNGVKRALLIPISCFFFFSSLPSKLTTQTRLVQCFPANFTAANVSYHPGLIRGCVSSVRRCLPNDSAKASEGTRRVARSNVVCTDVSLCK